MSSKSAVLALVGTANDSNSLNQSQKLHYFMKGAYNNKPPLPRYNNTWDVSLVLHFLEKLSHKSSSLLWLNRKLATLLSLLTGHRGQSIHKIDLADIECSDSSLLIRFSSPLKQTKPGVHTQEVIIPAYKTPGLCIVANYRALLSRTRPIRSKGTSKLFISSIKPHRAVARDTVSNWIKFTLKESGVDMSVFSAHSTRAASVSSAAESNVPLGTILRTAGWSNDSCFRKFYKLPIRRDTSYAQAILDTVETSDEDM